MTIALQEVQEYAGLYKTTFQAFKVPDPEKAAKENNLVDGELAKILTMLDMRLSTNQFTFTGFLLKSLVAQRDLNKNNIKTLGQFQVVVTALNRDKENRLFGQAPASVRDITLAALSAQQKALFNLINELHTRGEWPSEFDVVYLSYFLLFFTSLILIEKKIGPVIQTDKSMAKRILETNRKDTEKLVQESGLLQKFEKFRIKEFFEDNFAQYDVVSRHLLEERTDYFITQELKSQGREMHLGKCLDQIFEIALDPANFSNEKEQAYLPNYVVHFLNHRLDIMQVQIIEAVTARQFYQAECMINSYDTQLKEFKASQRFKGMFKLKAQNAQLVDILEKDVLAMVQTHLTNIRSFHALHKDAY